MKKFNLLYVVCVLVAVTGITHAQQIPIDPKLRTGKLSNGLTYYIRHNELPKGRADFYLVQKVGSVLEEENQRGLAHFLEHMAFNGSLHFPGNSLITELEKKGIRFGANINASTSYDETVYKLTNIPSGRNGIIDTALLVLHDWSGFLTLNDKDIDGERGVIREEWRLSTNGELRALRNEIFPVIFAGTPYADRLPIGSIDVVNNFKYQELRDYYRKWYRPDLQGIIISGDIDVDRTEAAIKKLFGDIPAPIHPATRIYSHIPDNKEPLIVYAADKEITENVFMMLWKLDGSTDAAKPTLSHYKNDLVKSLITGMLTNRFMEVREQADPPFASVFAYTTPFVVASLKPALELTLRPVERTGILKAFRGVFTEIERLHRFGFTRPELADAKKNVLIAMKKAYTDKGLRQNADFINDYTKLFLAGEPAPGIEWEYPTIRKMIEGLSLDTINFYARRTMGTKNMVIYATVIQDDYRLLPDKEKILNALQDAKSSKPAPYVYKAVSSQLLAKEPAPGKIITTASGPFGFTEWTLSNGARVFFKKTNYKEDRVILTGSSPGGYSLVSDTDLPSAKYSNITTMGGFGNFSLNDMAKALTGKIVSLSASVKEFNESIEGASSMKDRKTLFQLAFLKMTSPRKDQSFFNSWARSAKEGARDRYVESALVFKDSINDIMNNYSTRGITLDRDTAVINQIDYDKSLHIYKDRFADASNFTFFITGNIAADSIRPLVETYLGSLPSSYRHEKEKDNGLYPPKGIVEKHFIQSMKTPKSTIYVAYTGDAINLNLQNQVLMSFVGRVLTINYLENMREKEGGVYYISASGWVARFPKNHFTFEIRYSTDPDPVKKAKLMAMMYAAIDSLISQGPDPGDVDKAKLNMLKVDRERKAEQDAGYWNQAASEFYTDGINRPDDYEKTVKSVTPAMIQDFAKKIFTQGNRVEILMDPK